MQRGRGIWSQKWNIGNTSDSSDLKCVKDEINIAMPQNWM